ncbi:grl-18 [Pristionchus pacificus]|uniref:Grl-18 n=1 Tax=Pristionchus pacificus TaxID=54126 RepID=A0A2A6CSF6_PRIPA|nr:grl-18 [Pristionchus pacificus]|eukprot:PDM80973.1 grl-18 [Pristionchus pacificus]
MIRRFPLLLLIFIPSSFSFLQSLLCPCNRNQCQQSSLPLCQSHCASSCGGGGGQPVYPTQPSYGGGYGSAFGASYLPSAYQPPTVYRPQPLPQPQPLYANYALPRPLPPPQAPPLDSQPQINVEAASAPSAAAYVSHHPTLLQPAPGYPTSLPAHPPDFDSSASLIQYSTLKRGEGRSLRGALRPRTTPLAPDGEEPFETFERNHMKREETDEELQEAVSPSDREEELYDDDAMTAPPRDNDIAFHAPREKEDEHDGPSAAEGDDDETLARILKEEKESGQGSFLGRGYKFIKWAAQGNRKKKDNQEEELGPPLKHKCNNPELRRIMEEKMVGSPSASKQLVYSAVRAAFGKSPDVICSRSSFSYIVVSSPVYCEHKKAPSTCFVYFQP